MYRTILRSVMALGGIGFVATGVWAGDGCGETPSGGASADVTVRRVLSPTATVDNATIIQDAVWRPSAEITTLSPVETDASSAGGVGWGDDNSQSLIRTVAAPVSSTVVYSPVTTVATTTTVPVTTYSPVTVSAPVTTYSPVTVTAPVTTYSPVTVSAPVTTYSPAVVTAPVTTYAPVTAYSPVTVSAPVTVYSPVAVAAPVAVTTYSPVTAVVSAAVPVGPAVLVRPKVYVAGQPVRNFFRAITP